MTLFELPLGEHLKVILDVTSITALLGVISAILPVIASLLTVVWMGYRVYEEVEKRHFKKEK